MLALEAGAAFVALIGLANLARSSSRLASEDGRAHTVRARVAIFARWTTVRS